MHGPSGFHIAGLAWNGSLRTQHVLLMCTQLGRCIGLGAEAACLVKSKLCDSPLSNLEHVTALLFASVSPVIKCDGSRNFH